MERYRIPQRLTAAQILRVEALLDLEVAQEAAEDSELIRRGWAERVKGGIRARDGADVWLYREGQIRPCWRRKTAV